MGWVEKVFYIQAELLADEDAHSFICVTFVLHAQAASQVDLTLLIHQIIILLYSTPELSVH